jgi:hypothetical protein
MSRLLMRCVLRGTCSCGSSNSISRRSRFRFRFLDEDPLMSWTADSRLALLRIDSDCSVLDRLPVPTYTARGHRPQALL